MKKVIKNLRKVRPRLRSDRKYLSWLLNEEKQLLPNRSDLLFYSKGTTDTIGGSTDLNEEELLMYIDESWGYIRSKVPSNANHEVQQVKGSGFAGAGSATANVETTDVITATGTAPTCTVDGTLTFPGPDCWDIYVHDSNGDLKAYWPGINIGETTEIDASGNNNHLTDLTTTTITERTDGTGTNYANESGYSARENLITYSEDCTESVWNKLGDDTTVELVGGWNKVSVNSDTTFFLQHQRIPGVAGKEITMIMSILGGEPDQYFSFRAYDDGSIGEPTADRITSEAPVNYRVKLGVPTTDILVNLSFPIATTGVVYVKNILVFESKTPAIYNDGDSISTKAVNTSSHIFLSHPFLFADHFSVEIDNEAVGGTRLDEIASSMVSNLSGGSYNIVMFGGGTNDILQAGSDPNASMQSNFATALTAAKAAGTTVIYLIAPDCPVYSAAKKGWRDTFRDWVLANYSTDSQLVLIDPDVLLSDADFATDGIHPTIGGQAKIYQSILSYVPEIPGEYETYAYVKANDVQITGRQPAGFQDFTDYQGPLGCDLEVVSGDTYPDIVVKAPLGPKFQGLPTWTGEATVDLSTFVDTAKTRFGSRSGVIYETDQDADAIAKIDKIIGNE